MAANGLPVLVAGDTYLVSLAIGALAYVDVYPAADGWTFTATLAGPGTARATATRTGNGVALALTADASATLAPGTYRVTVAATRTVGETLERMTIATATVVVIADPAGGLDPRHPDEEALALAYARRKELLADGMKQYAVGGAGGQRLVLKRDLAELTVMIRQLERRIAARRNAAAGNGPFGSIAVGFPASGGIAAGGGTSLQTAGVTRVGVFG